MQYFTVMGMRILIIIQLHHEERSVEYYRTVSEQSATGFQVLYQEKH